MITSKTPLRISFLGGGTDLPVWYERYLGMVVSTTINKYIYVSVNPKFDDNIRVSYSITENVKRVSDIQHDIVRHALQALNIKSGIEIVSVADIPGQGTGLGSSSAFTVGLLNALTYMQNGHATNPGNLAEMACDLEINKMRKPIGKQDQYVVSHGGFNSFYFQPNDLKHVVRIPHSLEETNRHKDIRKELKDNLILFWTGLSRSSSSILTEQSSRMKDGEHDAGMVRLVELARMFGKEIGNGDFSNLGEYLHESWMIKRDLSSGISNAVFNETYRRAREAGAIGGKLLGAGGGGFWLFYAPIKSHQKVIDAVGLQEVEFDFEEKGSEIIYVG